MVLSKNDRCVFLFCLFVFLRIVFSSAVFRLHTGLSSLKRRLEPRQRRRAFSVSLFEPGDFTAAFPGQGTSRTHASAGRWVELAATWQGAPFSVLLRA